MGDLRFLWISRNFCMGFESLRKGIIVLIFLLGQFSVLELTFYPMFMFGKKNLILF